MIKIPLFICTFFNEYHVLHPHRLTELRRVDTILFDKSFAESRHIVKADHLADFDNRIFLLQDQFGGTFDTDTTR